MKYLGLIIFTSLIYSNSALCQVKNSLCQKAHIKSLFVDKKLAGTGNDDICALKKSETPASAQLFLQQVEDTNNKIVKNLKLPMTSPFLDELTLELKVSELSIIDSAYELKNNIPTVRLGTTSHRYFDNFSKFVYTHELGHWYISRYLKQIEKISGLKNIPTFQEFFADALVIGTYGDLDTSDIDAPYCIRQIRNIGNDNTFKKSIGSFDYSSYFKHSNQCCSALQRSGHQTSLSKSICKENKTYERFYFPNGLPDPLNAPLHYNVNSLYLNTDVNKQNSRLEPHRTSTPMNSFLSELSTTVNIPMLDLLLPALKIVTKDKIAYKCGHEELLKQGVYDLTEKIELTTLDYLFLEIRKQLKMAKHIVVFDTLYKKYSMRTAQIIFRNEIIDTAKFSVQFKLKNKLFSAWDKGKYFLREWHCLDQASGEPSRKCKFSTVCMPEDQEKILKREFIRRNKNKSVHTPIVKFVNQDTKKEVLFVGLNHTGPKHYYENVQKYLKKKLGSSENLVLREFFTCKEQQPVLNSNITNVSDSESAYLNHFLKNIYFPYTFFKLDEVRLSPLIQTYQLYEDSCTLDLDDKTLRPRNIVERNKKVCNKAYLNSIDCQWETIEKFLSRSPNTKEGDLVLSEEPVPVQISSINMYRGLPTGGNLDLWTRLLIPSSYVLDDYRETNLIQNTINELNSGKKRVILPWGVGHIQAIKELLYKEGFKQLKVIEIPYAHMSDYGHDEGIDSMLTIDFDYIGTEYNF